MYLIKSIFILFAPIILLLIVVLAIIGLLQSSQHLLFFGLLISALPLLVFLSYILLFKKLARTSLHLPWVLLPSFFGYCLVLLAFMQSSKVDLVFHLAYAMLAFFVTFLYIYWYSNNSRKISQQLLNKQLLPEFNLTDVNHQQISSTQFIGKKHLIFFIRGNWCPFCVAQIEEVVKHFQNLHDLGINVVFITAQPEENLAFLVKKFNVAIQFYVDKNNQAAKQLAIVHKFGLPMGLQSLGYASDSVYPTVLATDKNGIIVYNNQTTNYRLRPEISELLAVFD